VKITTSTVVYGSGNAGAGSAAGCGFLVTIAVAGLTPVLVELYCATYQGCTVQP
jgi:hypothetical protein